MVAALVMAASCAAEPEQPDIVDVSQPAGTRAGVPHLLPPSGDFGVFPDSPLRVPLAESSFVVSNESAAYVDLINEVVADDGAALALRSWTTPIYSADATTPLRDISLSASWAPASVLHDVPIPDGALADPQDDGNISIIDRGRGCEWDMWQVKRDDNGGWHATWANAISTSGDGIFPNGLSSRGSGFALSQGVIWPDEITAGRIDHVLIFSYPFTSSAGSVGWATETDGWSDRPDALPEGARLRLSPSVDVEALSLPEWQKTIARAMQEYGLLLVDDGGGVQLYGVHPWSAEIDAWLGVIDGQTDLVSIDDLPWSDLEVMDFGTPEDREVKFTPDTCARFDVATE